MSDLLPDVIAAYFKASNAGDADEASACFAKDAIVHDEARDHEGLFAIRVWVEETTRQYRPQTEVLQCTEDADEVRLVTKVSGTFPGSPIELDYLFTLREGKISRLRIG